MMKRREFISLLGGAAAWPLAARAQQSAMPVIGFLGGPTAKGRASLIAAFQKGLTEVGYSEGRQIDTRWATTDAEQVRKQALELAALAPDVILAASGTTTVAPLLQATRTVPIVFVVVIDPVGAGFVANLARPGGNATGFLMFEYGLSGKWLERLKQTAPALKRVAVLRDPTIASGIGQFGAIHSAAPSLGLEAIPVNVRDEGDIERNSPP
jgi:putative ABC transport system substrate-binding protein